MNYVGKQKDGKTERQKDRGQKERKNEMTEGGGQCHQDLLIH